MVHDIYKSRLSGPVASSHVKPRIILEIKFLNEYQILTITTRYNLCGILTTSNKHCLIRKDIDEFEIILIKLTATIFAACALNPPIEPAIIDPSKFFD
jgi:hypothetical protein